MKRLGVVVGPDTEISRRSFAATNGAVYMNEEGHINIYPREVSDPNIGCSTISLDRYTISHKLIEHCEPVVRGDCYEDPRLCKINDRFFLSCTQANLMITGEWKTDIVYGISDNPFYFDLIKPDLPMPGNNKNGVFIPERIKGSYWLFHRVRPDICLAYSTDLYQWHNLGSIMKPTNDYWQSGHLGAGTPPIKTEEGWLEFYHATNPTARPYCMGACLLDLNDPTKVLARTTDPLLFPEESYEINGWVTGGIIFPTGAIVLDNIYRIYYGAADMYFAAAEFTRNEIFDKLKPI